jgi:hypothetical protein
VADASLESELDAIVDQWRDIGVLYGGDEPSLLPTTPVDLEQTLLDTVRLMVHMPRLFNTTATWLHAFGDLIAKHRLRRLVEHALDPSLHPALGALLDTAQQGQTPREFTSITSRLSPADQPRSIFAIMEQNLAFAVHAEQRTGAIGRRWRVHLIDEPLRPKVLRPARWIMERHPDFVFRADVKGDLRASVMAALTFDDGAGSSELALAEAAGGSRAQIRKALDQLEMTGRVSRQRSKAGSRIEVLRTT